MTKMLISLLIICLIAFKSVAQRSTDVYISNLQTLFKAENPTSSVPVQWLEKEKIVQIGDYLYPVGETTVLKWVKNQDTGFSVEFFMQQGTAVSQADNPAFRRAWWKLSFSSKESCKEFVKLFEGLKKEVSQS